ncbi:sporulation protein [Bacillus sp. BHET2]|nr:sporulation protein [Bacillus sp. BHET2]
MEMIELAEAFFPELFKSFFIAMGVLLGGSLLGGLASFAMGQPLFIEMRRLSDFLRIWAIIAAIGGTFDTVYSFEKGFLNGETKELFKQFLWILSALGGANTAAMIITWLTQEHMPS